MISNKLLSVTSNQKSASARDNKIGMGVVYHVVLETSDPILDDYEIPSEEKSRYIAAIIFRLDSEPNKPSEDLSFAFPKNLSFNRLPLKNEQVSITESAAGGFYYEILASSPSPNISSSDNTIEAGTIKDIGVGDLVRGYKSVSHTGIFRNVVDDLSNYTGFGDYFDFQEKIHTLKLYEGDLLIQSRFGQSVRFSGYNNSENEFSPTIILRNRESGLNQNKDFGQSVEEDVNRDGSVIVLSSDKYKLNFQPGTVSASGSSDFQTKPDSFSGYPSELKGDQILLNSGRLVLSAKTDEMIFYSKKNYGFISDGTLSIDNEGGIEGNVNADINITTNNNNINLNTDNGRINLGNKDLESVVRGETLLGLLEEVLDAIVQQIYLTPSGPTSMGPTNFAQFNAIKARLRTMLSTLNKTS